MDLFTKTSSLASYYQVSSSIRKHGFPPSVTIHNKLSWNNYKNLHHRHQRIYNHNHDWRHHHNIDLFKIALNLFFHHDVGKSTRQTPDYETDSSADSEKPLPDVSSLKPVIHGTQDLAPYLNPLDDQLRDEIIKYGEFAQATYDTFDFNIFSNYCGSCLYGIECFFDKLGLNRYGYIATKFLYAMSHTNIPHWLEKLFHPNAWDYDSNWMGYVAVSGDAETKRIGCRDVLVVWRGTIAPHEWVKNVEVKLEHIGPKHEDIAVEHGFYSLYTSKSKKAKYNHKSTQDQVLEELRRLIPFFKKRGEDVCLTLVGHSLGGALSFLTAYDAMKEFPDLPISVITFGSPRVGNKPFCDKLEARKIQAIRVVVKNDLVPLLPGIVFDDESKLVEGIEESCHWLYAHYGHELHVDVKSSPYLNHGFTISGYHNLEIYLHLVDGHVSRGSTEFRKDVTRDVALVNKSTKMLNEKVRVPPFWYQPAFKGLVCNSLGRWVMPKRDQDDIPPPPDKVLPLSVFD